ncbi:MAG: family 43 glycosylhydrolase [Kiritimatiellae bacterium]|nr:family 43 glycosylhydrolase [Kiritimatiellia bacterium]
MKGRLALLAAALASGTACAEPVRVDVAVSKPGHEVPASLWGAFIEDIAFSVDGCLYPELVWNRGFEFRAAPSDEGFADRVKGPCDLGIPGWYADCRDGSMGRFTLQYARPLRADTPAYLRMEAFAPSAGVRNTGALGDMAVKRGEKLSLSLYARGDTPLVVRVETKDDKTLAEARFEPGTDWKRFAATLVPSESASKVHLLVMAERAGTAEIEFVSLMPERTFRGHGLRRDIAQLIAELRPANFRFPGGCMLESCDYAGWFDWKRTVGDVESRQPLWNIWGYYQNVGLGFFEYFRFCEDIGTEPLPVFIGGRTCQFRNSKLFPKESLGYLVTNMLDAIEFARGGTDTKWGALRAKMGHPAPFPLKTIGIGNENWGKEYFSRLYPLAAGVKAVHPDIKVIASIDPHTVRDPPRAVESWAQIRKGEVDFADEHMYASPSWWLNHVDRYDGYDRSNVPVYIGEWGTRDIRADWRDGLYVALAEAAFRIGIEKNSDVVKMVAYAPLARRRDAPRDGFSLIDVTPAGSCGNPTYYAEKMFSHNRLDRVVDVSYPRVAVMQPAGWERAGSPTNPKNEAVEVVAFHAGAGLVNGELVVRLVNASPEEREVKLAFDAALPAGRVRRQTLSGEPGAKNTPEDPRRVTPVEDEFDFAGGGELDTRIAPYSFTLLRLTTAGAPQPNWPGNFPDPTVWRADDGTWRATSTSLRILRSDDFFHWEDTGLKAFAKDELKRIHGKWKHIWAPDSFKLGDELLLYVSLVNSAEDSAIAVYSSKGADGPFSGGRIIVRSKDTGIRDTIDPEVVRDDRDGTLWLFFGSTGKMHRVKLAPDGKSLAPGATCEHVAGLWGDERGDPARRRIFEGAYLHRRGGWWYLFASRGWYGDGTYAVVVGRAKTLDGPFLDRDGHDMRDGFATVVHSSDLNDRLFGPGHNAEIVTIDGRDYLPHHCHVKGETPRSRPFFIRELSWDSDGWPSVR